MDDVEKIRVFRDIIRGSDLKVVAKEFINVIERMIILELMAEDRGINIEEEIEKLYDDKWEKIKEDRDNYIDFVIGRIVYQLEG
jgi:hypothetical protein